MNTTMEPSELVPVSQKVAGPYHPLHARPLVPVQAPHLVSVLAFLVSHDGETPAADSSQQPARLSREDIKKVVSRCCVSHPQDLPPGCERESYCDRLYEICSKVDTILRGGGRRCVLQNHLNFFVVQFFKKIGTDSGEWDATVGCLDPDVARRAVFKTHIRVEATRQPEFDDDLEAIFNSGCPPANGCHVDDVYADLLASRVSDGGATVWTPFRPFHDGFNRILIRNMSLQPARLGRLVRRLAEIDLYMTLGLSHYDAAQEQLKQLADNERRLGGGVGPQNKNNTTPYQDEDNYRLISGIADDLSEKISRNRYAFEAALAYAELVSRRVYELREERVEGWTRIGYFIEKNFTPCIKTCEAALRYQEVMSQRIQERASLLGTRIVLQTKKDERKFRRVIETIGAVAIAYYGSSILDKSFPERDLPWLWSAAFIIAAVVAIIWVRINWRRFASLFVRPRKIPEKHT